MSSLKEILNDSVEASFDFIENIENNDIKVFILCEEHANKIICKIIIDLKGVNLVSVEFVIRGLEDSLRYINFLDALETVIP